MEGMPGSDAAAPCETRGLTSLESAERETILGTIKACRGNMTAVARELGIAKSTVYAKLKRFGLEALVEAGRFRHDLLYRLNVVHIEVPPLRARREDIPLLVEHLMRRAARRGTGAAPPRFTACAMQRLLDYPWPGNVRELRNVVERLLVFGGDATMDVALIDSILSPSARAPEHGAPTGFDRIAPLAEVEQAYIRWVVEALDGNVSAAAARLGIARSTIYRNLRELAGKPHS
ncbi:MAG TPA: helix-turn-helix domain-containing protein, partial [Rhodocyclaceae bacterium]|nr:helix-turn-helix domain-containing protein [Rhodocyclaceae bacterium]